MTEQRELEFHDTVPLPMEMLENNRRKASRQKDKILVIFRSNHGTWYTPYQIMDIYRIAYNEPILITSVRRSITDLTNEGITGCGRLLKSGSIGQVRERYKTNNNRWMFNEHFISKINP
jgi:Fe2+ or Zn2+ uptake regulation protein